MTDRNLISCQRCQRLRCFLGQQKKSFPDYHNAPVAPYGDSSAALLIVGLAPGLHGANASGIPFTGDSSGRRLFQQLRQHGFVTRDPADDGSTQLLNCRITNAVKCLPPNNLPSTREIARCNRFLKQEINDMPDGGIILALGSIAHKAVLKALGLTLSHFAFAHGVEHRLSEDRILLDSYHCSRYNFNTGRLSEPQFAAVFQRLSQLLQ